MIFIPGNVPSSKNSKIKTSRGIFHSKAVRRYLQELGVKSYSVTRKTVEDYKTRINIFKSFDNEFRQALNNNTKPYKIGFHFVRKTRAKFDFHNMVQIIADLMVAHNFILDDDMDNFLPYPLEIEGKYYSLDKVNPGVIITLI